MPSGAVAVPSMGQSAQASIVSVDQIGPRPMGWVPAGNWFYSEKSCAMRGVHLMYNPPPLMTYTDYYCFPNYSDDRWSLLMWSPEVGCVVATGAPVTREMTDLQCG
ncbi:hypothetical protein SAMN04488554_0528 [Ruania alba]|uniref:Uncharacterized protein n=1 Tax=Ruania alba TaxID=648782 RepID=A0A1H5D0B5_9MICO|nr:hypothetical protein SAMN04488554_0528 [Ruania alba]